MAEVFVHESSFVDPDVRIGKGTKIWHFCHIMPGAEIGSDCSLGQNTFVGRGVKIGNNCRIQNNVSIYEGVTLEDGVFCGPSCVFTNDLNPRSLYPKAGQYMPTLVRYGASVGANVTILCGTTIGRHAFIGASAVVTKDVPDYALVYGSPAKVRGWICQCGTKLAFRQERCVCSECHREFALTKNNTVVECSNGGKH